MKRNVYHGSHAQMYFWRTQQQQEIDLLEEADGKLMAFEFKWKKNKSNLPKAFATTYPDAGFEVVSRENYGAFVGVE